MIKFFYVILGSTAIASCAGRVAKERSGEFSSSQQGASDQIQCEHEPEDLNFAAQGSKWHDYHISYSYMPDGTLVASTPSKLFTILNPNAPEAVWKREFAKSLAKWAAVTPINFRLTNDSGAAMGVSGVYQGDNRFGDIRFGSRGDQQTGVFAYSMYPSTSTSGGDSALNSNKLDYNVNARSNIQKLMLHEIGHSLGLMHSTVSWSAMYSSFDSTLSPADLTPDDLQGIQSVYGARPQDSFDSVASNDSELNASQVALASSGATFVNGDITTQNDADYYKFTAPQLAGQSLVVTLLDGQSLLTPRVRLLSTNGDLIAESTSADYGLGTSISSNQLVSGSDYLIAIDGPTHDDFAVGAYRMAITVNATSAPYTTPSFLNPDSREPNASFAQTSSLGQTSLKTFSGLNLNWTWDEDFYSFTTPNTTISNFQVSVTPTAGSTILKIEIYSSSNALIATSTGTNSVTFPVAKNKGYKIKVLDPNRLPTSYSMTLKKIN